MLRSAKPSTRQGHAAGTQALPRLGGNPMDDHYPGSLRGCGGRRTIDCSTNLMQRSRRG
jgi:hypothetical protein